MMRLAGDILTGLVLCSVLGFAWIPSLMGDKPILEEVTEEITETSDEYDTYFQTLEVMEEEEEEMIEEEMVEEEIRKVDDIENYYMED